METLTPAQQLALSRLQVRSLTLQAQIRTLTDQLAANESAFKATVEALAKSLNVESASHTFDLDALAFVPKRAAAPQLENQCPR